MYLQLAVHELASLGSPLPSLQLRWSRGASHSCLPWAACLCGSTSGAAGAAPVGVHCAAWVIVSLPGGSSALHLLAQHPDFLVHLPAALV